MARSDGSVRINTLVNSDGFGKGINTMKKQMGGLTSAIGKLGLAIAATFAVGKLVQFGKEAIELGSDLQEVQNVVDVTFTTMSDKVNEFARGAAEAAGLSETMAKKYMGTFGAMSKAFGFVEEEAFNMSASLTQMVGDVASFYNLTQEEAYTKLKSVFTGETESLKDLGVVMTQTALDSYAMAEGWGKTTKQMTEQEKVALRYAFVLDQLSAANGDFVRTSDSWANQTRILSLTVDSLKANIGQALINVFTPLLKVINQVVAKLAEMSQYVVAFSELIYGKSTSSGGGSPGEALAELESGYQGVTEATKDATKAQKKYLSGLDEIRTFTEEDAGAESLGPSGSFDFGDIDLSEEILPEKEIPEFVRRFAEKIKEIFNNLKTYIINEDWEGLASYISDGIVFALNWISERLDEINWAGLGKSIGEFISGIDWLEIIKSSFKLKFNIWKAIAEVWFGAFEAAPIETAIITAMAALKFTALGDVLAPKIASAIVGTKLSQEIINAWVSLGGIGGIMTTDLATVIGAGSFAEIGLTVATGLVASIVAAIIGFEVGKEIGKWLFPDEKDIYDSFSWFGEDGFFKQIFSDFGSAYNGFLDMINDFENNPIIASLAWLIADPFTKSAAQAKENLPKLQQALEEFKTAATNWWETKMKPIFSKENWIKGMEGVKQAFESVWKGAVNIAITLINNFIDYINEKMHFEWDAFSIAGKEIITSGNIQLFTVPKIPMLATGAVIPPNAPFMAMLGDQKHGTNIEAPLSTIESALDNVLNRRGGASGNMTLHNVMQLNRRVLYDEFIEEAKLRMSTTGRNPFDLA